ncbi:peroxidase [Trifolium repens]|nr:peroxidase [Trifolium repens]
MNKSLNASIELDFYVASNPFLNPHTSGAGSTGERSEDYVACINNICSSHNSLNNNHLHKDTNSGIVQRFPGYALSLPALLIFQRVSSVFQSIRSDSINLLDKDNSINFYLAGDGFESVPGFQNKVSCAKIFGLVIGDIIELVNKQEK